MNVEMLKLGKLEPRVDERTLKLEAIFSKALPPVPEAYDFDALHNGIPLPMFATDRYGDCVTAGPAYGACVFISR